MIYNIAVFGSCASRDNFYSGINPDYKKYFNCSISSQRGSIISLMQEPVPFKNQDIQEFIIGNSVSSVVGAVILFAIIFCASGFLLDMLHDAKFNEEIDEIRYHNNTVTVDEFTQFGPDFSKAYWIVGDNGRKYTISEGMYNKLNAEYNNSVAGHKLNIFFNVKKTARSGHITYMADNITTDSGIIIK